MWLLGQYQSIFNGRPRTSADIDIALVSRVSKEKLQKILADRYTLYYNGKAVMKFIDSITRTGVDILLSLDTAGLSRESLKRLRKVEVDGVRITIPCPEDYIITKLKARRPDTFDFSDVMSVLLNMSEQMDRDYLMKRAEEEGLKWKAG